VTVTIVSSNDNGQLYPIVCSASGCSYPPYFDDDPFRIYDRILEGKISWPKYTDPVAKYVSPFHAAFLCCLNFDFETLFT